MLPCKATCPKRSRAHYVLSGASWLSWAIRSDGLSEYGFLFLTVFIHSWVLAVWHAWSAVNDVGFISYQVRERADLVYLFSFRFGGSWERKIPVKLERKTRRRRQWTLVEKHIWKVRENLFPPGHERVWFLGMLLESYRLCHGKNIVNVP